MSSSPPKLNFRFRLPVRPFGWCQGYYVVSVLVVLSVVLAIIMDTILEGTAPTILFFSFVLTFLVLVDLVVRLVRRWCLRASLDPWGMYVTSYLSSPYVRIRGTQAIPFDEIAYVYYLRTEASLLLRLREMLKKHKLPASLSDYRRGYLEKEYLVDPKLWEEFDAEAKGTVRESALGGVHLALEELANRHEITIGVRKQVRDLVTQSEVPPYAQIEAILLPLGVDREEVEQLHHEYRGLEQLPMAPFMRTKLLVEKFRKTESSLRAMWGWWGLVFANHDGSFKLYFMHFHGLSKKDRKRLVAMVRERAPQAKFLMTERDLLGLG